MSDVDVCKHHEALANQIGDISKNLSTITTALVGEDLRGGVVAELAQIRVDVQSLKAEKAQRQKQLNRRNAAKTAVVVGVIAALITGLLDWLAKIFG
jgi:hypothetical protein